MDSKSKKLIYVFILILAVSIAWTFYNTVVLQNFDVVYDEESVDEDY